MKRFLGYRDGIDPPIARKRNPDPLTSQLAEARFTLTKRATRQRQVLYLVAQHPDQTNGEYARLMLEEFPFLPIKTCCESPHKRLSDLHEKGLIYVTGERKCTDTGYEARTWALTRKGVYEMRSIRKEELR